LPRRGLRGSVLLCGGGGGSSLAPSRQKRLTRAACGRYGLQAAPLYGHSPCTPPALLLVRDAFRDVQRARRRNPASLGSLRAPAWEIEHACVSE